MPTKQVSQTFSHQPLFVFFLFFCVTEKPESPENSPGIVLPNHKHTESFSKLTIIINLRSDIIRLVSNDNFGMFLCKIAN